MRPFAALEGCPTKQDANCSLPLLCEAGMVVDAVRMYLFDG